MKSFYVLKGPNQHTNHHKGIQVSWDLIPKNSETICCLLRSKNNIKWGLSESNPSHSTNIESERGRAPFSLKDTRWLEILEAPLDTKVWAKNIRYTSVLDTYLCNHTVFQLPFIIYRDSFVNECCEFIDI